MLAPHTPQEILSATPPAPGVLSGDQPFGSLTLPVALTASLRLTPEQFQRLCEANPEAVLELAADGHVIAMTPTCGETSSRNSRLLIQLGIALPSCDSPLRIFDSSGCFRLPDGSVRSPDASLVLEERWQALTAEQRRQFPPLCPDLVVELVSPSDEEPSGLTALRQKMATYQRNGARLGWLLIPAERAVEVWGPLAGGEQGRRLEQATRLEGAPEFPGLSLDLEPIWAE
ncbi:Uma2 family endonuclease [Cyanobium sp. FGCU-52]|nr:Uma2 family endonuclease [Cyanobium sp. FGCU52]